MSKELPHKLFDEMIHQRTRLAIMVTLAGVDALEFNELKAQLGLTDGNLSTHASALEKAGYVSIVKSFHGKKPRTKIAMAAKGRRALEKYVAILQGVLDKTKK